jgi:hypothetical protein
MEYIRTVMDNRGWPYTKDLFISQAANADIGLWPKVIATISSMRGSMAPLFHRICAWQRILTGRNHQHKRYFRHIYNAYAAATDENLSNLHRRLKHGSFRPKPPTRIFLPKASGLQRPLTLLSLEDQIVLQAVANFFAKRLIVRRHQVEMKVVFSNILEKKKASIFFLKDWHPTYDAFTRRIRYLYNQGYCWVAAFDLAAFYDTIDHSLLIRTVYPRGGNRDFADNALKWFRAWTSEKASTSHSHGIPQGPIASDFLAECFLLPIDELLGQKHVYLRYVDDIRLLGKSETQVQSAAIDLEQLCRNRGLIPQAKKFAITKAKSLEEVLCAMLEVCSPIILNISTPSFIS